MKEQEILQSLNNIGAVITNSHIVYTSWKHGSAYINKDAVYPNVNLTSRLCSLIADHFRDENLYGIEAVVAPAVGGVILCTWIAYWLEQLTGRRALAIYAEKSNDGEKFVFNRGYDKLVADRRILIVEDVLTTGGSVKKVVEATRALGGKILGVGALCNRGNVMPQDVTAPEIFSLISVKMDMWDEPDCPLCKTGVPINTDVGKGKEYLAKKAAK